MQSHKLLNLYIIYTNQKKKGGFNMIKKKAVIEDQVFLMTLKELNPENKPRILGILKNHPGWYDLITIPLDTDVLKLLVEQNPLFAFRPDVDDPGDELLELAIEKNPYLAIPLLTEHDQELDQEVLEHDGLLIKYMSDFTKTDRNMRLIAFESNPVSMVFMLDYMSLEEIKENIADEGNVLLYISDAKLFQRVRSLVTTSSEDTVIQNNDQFILEMTRSQMRDIYQSACLSRHSFNIGRVPEKYLTEDFVMEIMRKTGDPIDKFYEVPLPKRTFELLKMCVEEGILRVDIGFYGIENVSMDDFKSLYEKRWRSIGALDEVNTSMEEIQQFLRDNAIKFGHIDDPTGYLFNIGDPRYLTLDVIP